MVGQEFLKVPDLAVEQVTHGDPGLLTEVTPVIVCSVDPSFAHCGSAPHLFFSVGTAEV